MKIATALFLFFCYSHLAQAQFELCNSPTTTDLWDVCFVDKDNGVAVGDSGTIIRSTDGGLNWIQVLSVDSIDLKKVRFFDDCCGLAVGTHILRTIDGGGSWSLVQPVQNYQYFDIEILNANTCLVSGEPTALIRSTDRGATWEILVEENPGNGIGLLSFSSEETGYACLYGSSIADVIWKTTDGGATWTETPMLTGVDLTVTEAFEFPFEEIGFRAGWYNPYLKRSKDSGENWQDITYTEPDFHGQLFDLHIIHDLPYTYYGCGWFGSVIRSVDLGNTWTPISSGVPTEGRLYGIFFIDHLNGWVVGDNGVILRTTNGGGLVDVEEPVKELELSVYPNPFDDVLHIDNPLGLRIRNVRIINAAGVSVFEGKSTTILKMGELMPGTYWIKILTDEGMIVAQMTKSF